MSHKQHSETAAGWEIVAKTKYASELSEHLEQLQAGGHNLLSPELRLLKPFLCSCKRAIHLQCSHGLDALGLLNLGVTEVVGVDISQEMISQAQEKTEKLKANARWYCCDILDTPSSLDQTADLVYTGKGALHWLMDIKAWAMVVARLLAPGGSLYLFEGHPLDYMWELEATEFRLESKGDYFSGKPREYKSFPASMLEQTFQTQKRPKLLERPWTLGEVIGALLQQGLVLKHFEEHPESYWRRFPNLSPKTLARLPHTYSILASKV